MYHHFLKELLHQHGEEFRLFDGEEDQVASKEEGICETKVTL